MLSPGSNPAVERFHSSGRWRFGSHWPFGVAEREDALLGARALLVAPRAAERRVEAAGLRARRAAPWSSAGRSSAACRRRTAACRRRSPRSLVWTISRAPTCARVPVAELDHLAELVGGVDVQQRERNRPGIERLLRQAQQHRRVLADRVEHHRPLELGDHLADDVDALGLERAQVVEPPGWRPVRSGCGGSAIVDVNMQVPGSNARAAPRSHGRDAPATAGPGSDATHRSARGERRALSGGRSLQLARDSAFEASHRPVAGTVQTQRHVLDAAVGRQRR